MLVKIDNEMALNMLMDRLDFWNVDDVTYHLFEEMYEYYIDGGCFEGTEFDVMKIVDNDYVNYCSVIREGDEAYEDIKKLYDMQGLGDISCDYELNNGYNFIEAEYNGNFLVRY